MMQRFLIAFIHMIPYTCVLIVRKLMSWTVLLIIIRKGAFYVRHGRSLHHSRMNELSKCFYWYGNKS